MHTIFGPKTISMSTISVHVDLFNHILTRVHDDIYYNADLSQNYKRLQIVYIGQCANINGQLTAHGSGELISDVLYCKGEFNQGKITSGVVAVQNDDSLTIYEGLFTKNLYIIGPNSKVIRSDLITIGEYFNGSALTYTNYNLDGKRVKHKYTFINANGVEVNMHIKYEISDHYVRVTHHVEENHRNQCIKTELMTVAEHDELSIVPTIPAVNLDPASTIKKIRAGIISDVLLPRIHDDVYGLIYSYLE